MTRGLTWHEELEAADLEREAAAREAAALQEVERSRSGWQVDFVGFVCFCWVFVLLDLQEDHDIYNWKIEVGDQHGSIMDLVKIQMWILVKKKTIQASDVRLLKCNFVES